MKPLILDVFQLIEWKNKERVLYASETEEGVLKRMYVNLNGGFEIHVAGKLVKETLQPYTACDFFNSLNVHDYK